MDPQQRILLQVAYEAAQDAHMPLQALRAAAHRRVHRRLQHRLRPAATLEPGVADIQAGTGTALSIVANRLSNASTCADPSLGVDTACSSSLVALDTGCRALREESADVALVGGVNVLLDPRMFMTFCRAHMLSRAGRIAAFDAERRRLRARRRRRRRRAQAARRCAARRRPHLRGDQVDRGQPGWRHRQHHRAQPGGAEGDAAGSRRQGRHRRRRRRLCGGARHRHAARRSDRGRRHRRSVRPGAQQRPGAHRLGEMQHRPSRAGRRHRRADQDRAGARARADPAEHQFQHAERAHSVRCLEHRGGQARDGARRRATRTRWSIPSASAAPMPARCSRGTRRPLPRRATIARLVSDAAARAPELTPIPLSAPTPAHLAAWARALAEAVGEGGSLS